MQPKLITFDYGGTLCQEIYHGDRAGLKALLPHIIQNPQKTSLDDLMHAAARFHATSGLHTDFETMSIQYLKYVFDYYNIQLDVDEAQAEQIFYKAAISVEKMPDILLLLEYLQQQQIKTAVISNLPLRSKTLEQRLKECLDGFEFEFVMTSADYHYKKPASNLFELALHRAEVCAEETWHCGDSYECDVLGARSVGITPILYGEADTDCVSFQTWGQMLTTLKTME